MPAHRIDPDKDFIREIIHHDLETEKHATIVTRFPPEPNGYLHIGHAKAICLNFTLAQEVEGARCHLRFDDTNPTKEEMEYVEAIKEDVRWLGFDWGEHEYFASDYFDQLYEYAVDLIKQGKAYVCDLSPEQIREYRGTLTAPGRESPYRNRTVEENLELFERMRRGEFGEGEKVLRAKIDMAAPNLNMRDPAIYRIRFATHHRTGDRWCIYPMYDFTHCLSDAIEHVTHSLCSLEFQDHRPLYDWFVDQLPVPAKPRQIEFARLNLTYTVMSKRKLLELVQGGYVRGWDDPRMPTLRGLRRRGFTPPAIRAFCDRIGVAKRDSLVDVGLLEHAVREDLNRRAQRLMAVLDPVKVVITNYPENQVEELEAINNPEDEGMGTRRVPFSRELYIERNDFREDPPKKFFRLAPGREVRLRYAYFIRCEEVIKDSRTGEITELRCTYDPETRGGSAPDGRKVRGTLHWISAPHAKPIEVRIYDRLFLKENPSEVAEGEDFKDHLNPDSLQTNSGGWIEPMGAELEPGTNVQFERLGYFCVDPDSSADKRVYNRTVSLKDTWAKIEKRLEQERSSSR